MDIKCYEFFGCKKQDGIMFKEGEERNCWEVEATLTNCTDLSEKPINWKDKIVFCKNCLFYQLAYESTQVESNFKFHNFD